MSFYETIRSKFLVQENFKHSQFHKNIGTDGTWACNLSHQESRKDVVDSAAIHTSKNERRIKLFDLKVQKLCNFCEYFL